MTSQALKRVVVVIGGGIILHLRSAEPYLRFCRLGKWIWNEEGQLRE